MDQTNTHGPTATYSLPLAILNLFSPTITAFASALQPHLDVDLKHQIQFLITIFSVYFLLAYAKNAVCLLIESYFMSTIRIRADDEVYNMVMLWISRQHSLLQSRQLFVNADISSRNSYLWRDQTDDTDDLGSSDMAEDNFNTQGQNRKLHFTPSFGRHLFWYGWHPLLFGRHENTQKVNFQSASEREELSISCLGRDPTLLKTLLQEVLQLYSVKDKGKTLIYRAVGGSLLGKDPSWQRCMSRPNRPFSSIILDEEVKENVISDATEYLRPSTRQWYSNRGIPYRRGYLFHGPPGTGKTSLSLAMAGFFRMRIYIINLINTSTTEDDLMSLFASLPEQCFVLLEDVDCAGLTRSRDLHANVPPSRGTAMEDTSLAEANRTSATSIQGRISLSGLLNVLDGAASQEGRVLIMTTNDISTLDEALVRPGRVDVTVPFRLANKEMASSIFQAIYTLYGNEDKDGQTTRGEYSHSVPREAELKEQTTKEPNETANRIEILASEFSAKLPEDIQCSPAEIQGLLLRFKNNPSAAIAATDEWIAQHRTKITNRGSGGA